MLLNPKYSIDIYASSLRVLFHYRVMKIIYIHHILIQQLHIVIGNVIFNGDDTLKDVLLLQHGHRHIHSY